MNRRFLVIISIIIALVIIGLALWKVDFYHKVFTTIDYTSQDLEKLTKDIKLELKSIKDTDHILGNPAAPVKVIEYADSTCIHCAEMQEILKTVLDERIKQGQVVWVFRNFLSDVKNNYEVRYLECTAKVSGNKKFWNYLEQLFDTPFGQKTESFLISKAKEIGVEQKPLADCLASDYPDKRVEKDMDEGIAAGVIGSPYIFVIGKNGYVKQIVGLVPDITVTATLDSALGLN